MNATLVRKMAWVADAALVAALAVAVTGAFGSGAKSAAGVRPVLSPNNANPQRPLLSEADFNLITKSGAIVPAPATASSLKPAAQPEEPKIADVSQGFNYELVGTAVEDNQAFAFFKDNSTGVQLCRSVGAEIGDGKLLQIMSDRALVQRGGRQGYIWRQKPKDDGASARAASQPGQGAPAKPGSPQNQQQPAAPAAGDTAGAQSGEGDQANANNVEQDPMVMSEKVYKGYLENIGMYINQVSTRTHLAEDNSVDGIQLVKVPPTSEAYKRGLREGDIIESLQGQPVQDVGAAIKQAWDIIKNEDYVIDVVIVRNGQEETLTYEIWPE